MAGDDKQYVKLPDGSYIAFPAGMKPDEISSAVQAHLDPEGAKLRDPEAMLNAAHAQARPTELPGGGQPSYAATALENSPSGADPHNPGNPNLNAVPEAQRADVNDKLVTVAGITAPMTGGAMNGGRGILAAGRGLLGTAIGGTAGAEGGGRVGSMLGHKQAGEIAGGFIGGTIGGGAGIGMGRNPTTGAMNELPFNLEKAVPEWMVPGSTIPEDERMLGQSVNIREEGPTAPMHKAAAAAANKEARAAMPMGQSVPLSRSPNANLNAPPVDPVEEAVKARIANRVPMRMPSQEAPSAPKKLPSTFTMTADAPQQGQAFIPKEGAPTPAMEFASRQAAARDAATQAKAMDVPSMGEGSPDDLISRTRQIVKPGEQPTAADLKRAGDLTQAPLDRLRVLARNGDKLAENELRRRLQH